MSNGSITTGGPQRDRFIVIIATVAATLVAWIYVVLQAQGVPGLGVAGTAVMPSMGAMANMPGMENKPGMAMEMGPWGATELLLLFLMWAIMMIGMMLPSAVPLIHNFMVETHQRDSRQAVFAPTAALILGYVAVWAGYSVIATLAQYALHEGALLSPMMVSTSPVLSGVLLIAAGIYQVTPTQYNLLKRCRQPLYFLRLDWREGTGGAFAMGLRHGAYCMGCCFVLMGVLFAGGIMNLLVVAAVTVFVLFEKCLPFGHIGGLVSGPLMIAAGVYVLVT